MQEFLQLIKSIQEKVAKIAPGKWGKTEQLFFEILLMLLTYHRESLKKLDTRYKSYVLHLCERLGVDSDEVAREIDAIDQNIDSNWKEISQGIEDYASLEEEINRIAVAYEKKIKQKKSSRKRKKRYE